LDAILDAADHEHSPVKVEGKRDVELSGSGHGLRSCIDADTLRCSKRPSGSLSSCTERSHGLRWSDSETTFSINERREDGQPCPERSAESANIH
jgi:hypothetical protein